jgi:P4 family phage/plasmid primase-like protien
LKDKNCFAEYEGIETEFTVNSILRLSQNAINDDSVFKANLREEYKKKPQTKTTPAGSSPARKLTIKKSTVFKPTTKPCSEFVFCLRHLSDERADKYEDWFKIACILKSACVPYKVFADFSSRSSKFNEEECYKFYHDLPMKPVDKPLTIAQLYLWFKEDSPEEFNEFRTKLQDTVFKQCDIEISRLYFFITKHDPAMKKYIYGTKPKCWFQLNNNTNHWEISSQKVPDRLALDIYDVLTPVFERELRYNTEQKAAYEALLVEAKISKAKNIPTTIDTNDIESRISEYNAIEQSYIKIIKVIGNIAKSDNIIRALTSDLSSADISLASFNLPHIFACNNIVFDCLTQQWRDILPADMVMLTTKTQFNPNEDLAAEEKELYQFFYSLFEDESLTEYFIKRFARCLNGNLQGVQNFNIFTGRGRNGKSLSFKIVMNAFGDYAYNMPIETIVEKCKEGRANSNLFDMNGKRLAIASEVEEDIVINIGVVKSLSGGDNQTCRQLYGTNTTFAPQCMLGVLCNTLPKFFDTSKAMDLRNRVMNFPFCFRAECVGVNDRPADNSIETRLMADKYKRALISMLSKYYVKYFKGSLEISNVPESIMNATREYNTDNDEVSTWFIENYEIKGSDKIGTTDLYSTFISETGSKHSIVKFSQIIGGKCGVEKKKVRGLMYWCGIQLKSQEICYLDKSE